MKLIQNFSDNKTAVLGSAAKLEPSKQAVPMSSDSSFAPAADFEESLIVENSTSGSWSDWKVSVPLTVDPIFESLNEGVAAVDSVGNVQAVGNGGRAAIRVKSSSRTGSVEVNTTKTGAITTRSFDGYVADSVADVLADSILSRITGTEDMNLFSNWSTAEIGTPAPTLIRNANCWAHGINLSGVSVQTTLKSRWGSENKGALVTPRHVVGAKHWNGYTGGFIGMKFRFLGTDDVIHERTVIGMSYNLFDGVFFTLDSALPDSVTPVNVIGSWFSRSRSYSGTSLTEYNGGVFFYVDQLYSCRLLLGASKSAYHSHYAPSSITANGNTYTGNLVWRAEFTDQTAEYGHTPAILSGKTSYVREGIAGDSGSPLMALVGGFPAVVGTFFYPAVVPFLGEYDGAVLNDCLAEADADAVARGNLVSPTGLTVTVAPDPTL